MTRTVEEIDLDLGWLSDLVNDHVHGSDWESIVWGRIDRLLDERGEIIYEHNNSL